MELLSLMLRRWLVCKATHCHDHKPVEGLLSFSGFDQIVLELGVVKLSVLVLLFEVPKPDLYLLKSPLQLNKL